MQKKQPITQTCFGCQKTKTHHKWYLDDLCKACHMRMWRMRNPAANRAIESRRKMSPAERSKQWRTKNPTRYKELRREIYRRTKPKFLARNAQRKARAKQATPEWLSPTQKQQIVHMYETCPPGHHVDHIVPLRGKNVCGLHVPWNLQHLPADENNRKGNRF